jgi:AcrR family transcriptional regulator
METAVSGRPRGRPKGQSEKGRETQERLYRTALKLFAERGYEETTLREIAKAAKVSPGLLYRYFPSKRAVVLALYNELSAEYAAKVQVMTKGSWRDRFVFALETSLEVLGPHRDVLASLTPVLVSRGDESLFAPSTAFARERVEGAFHHAVARAKDAPKDPENLGWLLYLVHLAIILWWLLDRTPKQIGTQSLLHMVRQGRALLGLAVGVPFASGFIARFARISRASLLGEEEGVLS